MVFTVSEDPVRGAVDGTFSTNPIAQNHARDPNLVYVVKSCAEPDGDGIRASD